MDEVCPVCGERLMEDELSGELVCPRCGVVAGALPYRGPEWRAYGDGDRLRRERAGAPLTPLIHDLGLSTLSPAERGLRGWEERRLVMILSEIYRLSTSMGLPRAVAETGALLLRRLRPRLAEYSREINMFPAALLHLAIRVHGLPIGAGDLAEASGLDPASIRSLSMRLAGALGVKALDSVEACIARLIGALGLPGEVEEHACRICELAIKAGLSQGRGRRALAAAAVYIAARSLGYKVSQKRVADLAKVSLTTLRRRLREIGRLCAGIPP
jgi:transcription initiation factor TFIIB